MKGRVAEPPRFSSPAGWTQCEVGLEDEPGGVGVRIDATVVMGEEVGCGYVLPVPPADFRGAEVSGARWAVESELSAALGAAVVPEDGRAARYCGDRWPPPPLTYRDLAGLCAGVILETDHGKALIYCYNIHQGCYPHDVEAFWPGAVRESTL